MKKYGKNKYKCPEGLYYIEEEIPDIIPPFSKIEKIINKTDSSKQHAMD